MKKDHPAIKTAQWQNRNIYCCEKHVQQHADLAKNIGKSMPVGVAPKDSECLDCLHEELCNALYNRTFTSLLDEAYWINSL